MTAYLSATQVCKELQITPMTLWLWEDQGKILVDRPEGLTQRRISLEEVNRIKKLPRDGRGIIWRR